MNNYTLGLGAKRDKKDRQDFRMSGIVCATDVEKQRFVLDDKFESNNQFQRGSCTSQAQSHHKERQENVGISARFIMALTKQLENNTSYGAYTRNTFKIVQKTGACAENIYPEPDRNMSWKEYIDVTKIPSNCFRSAEKHKSKSYWRIDKNANEIKQVFLNTGNSIVVSMAWYKEFNNPNKGLLPSVYSDYVGGHAVEFKGFDDFLEIFIFKNSFGTGWGDRGYFYIPYDMFYSKKGTLPLIWDLWSSLDYPENLPVDDYYGIKRTWQSFMREKSMAFNPWLRAKIGRLPNNREVKGLAYGFWSFDAIFRAKHGDIWLTKTKPQAIKEGLI